MSDHSSHIAEALKETTITMVCYNSGAILERGLRALSDVGGVVIVDNASTDGSADLIAQKFPTAVLIRNHVNVGYGPAMNQAMQAVTTPYALHLNPDAVIMPEVLALLYEEHQLSGPRTLLTAPLLESPNRGLDLTFKGPGERQPAKIAEAHLGAGAFCTWFVTGAVWLVRTQRWQELGGFDERIFLYQEDYEVCRRAVRQNMTLIVVPHARGDHLVSYSTKGSARMRWRKEWNIVWGHLYVTAKHETLLDAKKEVRRLLKKHAPKTLFYLLVLRRDRFLRDLAVTHASLTFLWQSWQGQHSSTGEDHV